MLTFEFTGVEGRMTESEVLTSGMVGKTVQVLFDSSWDSLTKTIVFRCDGICRTADGSLSPVTIPEDVLTRPFRRLYVGVYGTDEAGTVVIPTVMAEGPMIRYGADPTEDSAAEALPVWKGLQEQIGDLAGLETDAKENLVAAINEIHAELQLPGSAGTGLSETAACLLIGILRHGVYDCDCSADIDALEAALSSSGDASDPGDVTPEEPEEPDAPVNPEAVLTSLSVSYTGGDVPVGTPVHALTGITVMAKYSDGSGKTVSGYSLSGIILEGTNRITVTYQGLSVYFSVTGIPENSGNESPSPEQTETLEIVYTTSYPSVTTFAYTERDTAGQYVVAKQGQLKGGLLSVSYDADVCNLWNLNFYLFDADGDPCYQTDKIFGSSSYNWGQNELPGWENVGAGTGFGTVYAPFSVQLPEGCTAIACMRYSSGCTGDGTINGNASFAQWAKEGGITFTVTTGA